MKIHDSQNYHNPLLNSPEIQNILRHWLKSYILKVKLYLLEPVMIENEKFTSRADSSDVSKVSLSRFTGNCLGYLA